MQPLFYGIFHPCQLPVAAIVKNQASLAETGLPEVKPPGLAKINGFQSGASG
jgi:hypothetical protein